MDTDHGPLGPCVVNSLLEVVENPVCHEVFFDNFFTSVGLLKSLRDQGIKATGSIRVNRLNNTPWPPTKSMQKKTRGIIEVCSANDICAVRWFDNKVVTLASNNLTHEPLQHCSRYCRQKKQKFTIPQPFLIRQCNEHLNNLRPCIGGKKWYWLQLINFARVMQVAARYTMMKRFLNWDLSEVLYGNIFKIKGPQNLFYLIFLGLSHFQQTTILLFCLFKVDVRYVKRIPLKVVKNVTLDSMNNAFQHIISNLHDIKVV